MFEDIVLGAIQGFTEWIPVSSEGMVVLAKTHLFHSREPLNALINYSLFLHLGTFFAALIYFRKDIVGILKELPSLCPCCQAGACATTRTDAQKLLVFLVLTTVISGSLGLLVVKGMASLVYRAPKFSAAVMLLVASCLLVTGFLQWKSSSGGKRTGASLNARDGILLGIIQGFATLPGLSRSGTTIAALIFSGFDKKEALRLSFLMSMPIILFGNIILNIKHFMNLGTAWAGVISAFIVGIVSINFFMKITEKINFGVFLMAIGTLMIVAVML